MTDTTHEVPERIWFVKVGENIVPNSKRTSVEDVEYVRADLVQAAVAAALREAAKMLEETVGDLANPEHAKAVYVASQAILALITPDAQAALDRVVQARFGVVRSEVVQLSAEGKIDLETVERLLAAIRKGGE